MYVNDRDISRFSDRSRELWCEQNTSNVQYKENTFLRCCGNCPFASFVAFLLTLTGTGLFCGCLYYPLRLFIDQINNIFETEYIDRDWIRILHLTIIFISVCMGMLAIILLIIGSLATGTTRYRVYTNFRSRLTGRISTGFFIFLVYFILILWIIIMMCMTIPCIGLYILQYRCLDTWSKPTASGWPDSAAPYACLTPGTYGIPAPRQKPDARVCQQRFSELCTLTDHTPRIWTSLIGSVLVVLGLIHFLGCLIANYVHIKDGRKLRSYEEVIREEIELSKLNT